MKVNSRLNDDKAEVKSMLWKLQNRRLTRQENAYRWFIVEKSASQSMEAQQSRNN
jgi:hypothetical protein